MIGRGRRHSDNGHVGNRNSVCLYPPADIDTYAGVKTKDQLKLLLYIKGEKAKQVSVFIVGNKSKGDNLTFTTVSHFLFIYELKF